MKSPVPLSCIATLSFLITHQIDAAWWDEWELFFLPGGIQFFDLFNLTAMPVLLFGFQSIIIQKRSGFLYSIITGGLGVLTFGIHTAFFLFGNDRFLLPVSVGLIAGCGVTGFTQLLLTLRDRQSFTE